MAAEEKPGLKRRHLFGALGAAAAAAVTGPVATERAAADSENDAEKRKARYRESEEVKTYYRVNRYPS
jgi:hypothetical protein